MRVCLFEKETSFHLSLSGGFFRQCQTVPRYIWISKQMPHFGWKWSDDTAYCASSKGLIFSSSPFCVDSSLTTRDRWWFVYRHFLPELSSELLRTSSVSPFPRLKFWKKMMMTMAEKISCSLLSLSLWFFRHQDPPQSVRCRRKKYFFLLFFSDPRKTQVLIGIEGWYFTCGGKCSAWFIVMSSYFCSAVKFVNLYI